MEVIFLISRVATDVCWNCTGEVQQDVKRNIGSRSRNHCCRGKAISFRLRLKCDGTRAETRFRLSAKRTSPFKSAWWRQFSRLLAAEVRASAVVMLDTPCSEVV